MGWGPFFDYATNDSRYFQVKADNSDENYLYTIGGKSVYSNKSVEN